MTGSNNGESPWAAEVEPAPPPIEFVFASGDQAALPTGPPERRSPTPERSPRRWSTALGATLAIALVAGAAAVWFSNNDADTDGAAQPDLEENNEEDIEDLRDLRDLPVNADDAIITATSTNSPPIVSEFDDFEEFVDDVDRLSVATEYSVATGVWTTDKVDVPEALSSVAPMTLVVQTTTGLTEVDFPSGITRSTTFQPGFTFDEIAVGRIATYSPGGFDQNSSGIPPRLLTAGLAPTVLDVDGVGITMWQRPSTDRFAGVAFDPTGQSLDALDVSPDGSFTTSPIELSDAASLRGNGSFAPNGSRLFNSGGGVFERSTDGATRQVAEGELIATSSNHILTHSCDDRSDCVATLYDYRDDTSSMVDLPPLFVTVSANSLHQVSPDGRYLMRPIVSFGGSATLLDLQTGEVTRYDNAAFVSTQSTTKNHAWAADSSGYFRFSDGNFEFYDIATDRPVALPQLGTVTSYGVRLSLTGVPAPPELEDTTVDITVRAADETGAVYDLDLTTGIVISYDAPEGIAAVASTRLIVGPDSESSLLTTRLGPGAMQLSEGDRSSVRIRTNLNNAVLPGPDGTGWHQVDADGRLFEQFDTTGVTLEATMTVPVGLSVVGGDDNGHLLAVSGSGSTTVLTPTGAELLTEGVLLALGATTAIVIECVGTDCTTASIDRATGIRTTVDTRSGLATQRALQDGVGQLVENTVSPDGEVLMARADSAGWVIRDLAAPGTNDVDLPSDPFRSLAVVWSPDSQYALFRDQRGLSLYDRRNATITGLDNAPPVITFTAL